MSRMSRIALALCSILASLAIASGAPRQPAKAAAPAGPRLRALNYDLQGADGPLAAHRYHLLAALVMYLQPDLVALHHCRGTGPVEEENATAALARSLGMYHAFQPYERGGVVGSAILSRFPLNASGPASVSTRSPAVPGIRAQLWVRGKLLRVLALRPASARQSQDAARLVAAAMKGRDNPSWLLMASFSPSQAMETVKAWGRSGLQDALVAARSSPQATYPAASPQERLDFILLTPNLRPALRGTRVVRDQRAAALSLHLPVEATLAF